MGRGSGCSGGMGRGHCGGREGTLWREGGGEDVVKEGGGGIVEGGGGDVVE